MRTLFIISDLHLGGRPHDIVKDGAALPGYQFNHAYPALIEFINWVKDQACPGQGKEIELIINGDIVDFLAEDDYEDGVRAWTADENQASRKLRMIDARTWGSDRRGVFEALGDLLRAGNRLTLLIGNHDVELSLPAVRRTLLDLLGGEHAGLTFVYDGEAYRVGPVLIEHGNRYDRWNRIDHNGLREERSMRSRGLPPDEKLRGKRYFVPPAGTHMVIDVINRLKARYRFIDLLKPETGAVVPLLFALEPSSGKYLNGVISAYLAMPERFGNGMLSAVEPRHRDLMNKDEAIVPTFGQVMLQELDTTDAGMFIQAYRAANPVAPDADSEMSIRDDAMSIGTHVRDWIGQWQGAAADGIAALVHRNIAAIQDVRRRQLHAALRRVVRRDASFDIEHEDTDYLDAAMAIVDSADIDVVVNGHTHLPKRKQLDIPHRSCWYLNTGTWCDVLRLPQQLDQEFDLAGPMLDRFLAAMRGNDLQDYVSRYLSYVEVRLDAALALLDAPSLHSYCGRGKERCDPLTAYPTLHPTEDTNSERTQ